MTTYRIKHTWDNNRGQGSEESTGTLDEALRQLQRPQHRGTKTVARWRESLLAGKPVTASVSYEHGTAAGGGSSVTVTPAEDRDDDFEYGWCGACEEAEHVLAGHTHCGPPKTGYTVRGSFDGTGHRMYRPGPVSTTDAVAVNEAIMEALAERPGTTVQRDAPGTGLVTLR